MFKKVGPNEVESDEGFSVKRTARHSLEYRAQGKSVVVEVEPGDGLAVYRASIGAWQAGQSSGPVTKEERESMLVNISRALTFLRIKHLIE